MTIRTDLEHATFSGTAEITCHVSQAVRSITLHVAAPLELRAAVLSHSALKTESTRPATNMKFDKKRERVEIEFAGGEIAPGTIRLGLRWDGELETSMMGYYASTYPLPKQKEKGEKAIQGLYALTQFEPTQVSVAKASDTNDHLLTLLRAFARFTGPPCIPRLR